MVKMHLFFLKQLYVKCLKMGYCMFLNAGNLVFSFCCNSVNVKVKNMHHCMFISYIFLYFIVYFHVFVILKNFLFTLVPFTFITKKDG